LLTFLAGLIVGLLLGTTIGVITMAALAASSRNHTSWAGARCAPAQPACPGSVGTSCPPDS